MGHHNNNSGSTLLAFIAGVATATAIGGYFLYGPRGKENREKVARWMVRAKREILEKMEQAEDLTEDAYYAIVDEVTDKYARLKYVGKEKAQQAAGSFKNKWEDMRDMVQEAREEAEQEVEEAEQSRLR